MPDNIPKMEAELKEYLKRYDKAKSLFYVSDSENGVNLSPREQEVLNEIACSIELLEQEIDRRKKYQQFLLKSVDMQDVINYYGILVENLNLFIGKEVDSTYLIWQVHIENVASSYTKAVSSHSNIVANLKKHQDDVANIGGSILSVAGMGLLSW